MTFKEFIEKNYPELGNNPMGWTFEDESWTDYQAYHMMKAAYEAGLQANKKEK